MAGVLDFQDAVIGPIGIDPASLFKDLYHNWPEEKFKTGIVNIMPKLKKNWEWNLT